MLKVLKTIQIITVEQAKVQETLGVTDSTHNTEEIPRIEINTMNKFQDHNKKMLEDYKNHKRFMYVVAIVMLIMMVAALIREFNSPCRTLEGARDVRCVGYYNNHYNSR